MPIPIDGSILPRWGGHLGVEDVRREGVLGGLVELFQDHALAHVHARHLEEGGGG